MGHPVQALALTAQTAKLDAATRQAPRYTAELDRPGKLAPGPSSHVPLTIRRHIETFCTALDLCGGHGLERCYRIRQRG